MYIKRSEEASQRRYLSSRGWLRPQRSARSETSILLVGHPGLGTRNSLLLLDDHDPIQVTAQMLVKPQHASHSIITRYLQKAGHPPWRAWGIRMPPQPQSLVQRLPMTLEACTLMSHPGRLPIHFHCPPHALEMPRMNGCLQPSMAG